MRSYMKTYREQRKSLPVKSLPVNTLEQNRGEGRGREEEENIINNATPLSPPLKGGVSEKKKRGRIKRFYGEPTPEEKEASRLRFEAKHPGHVEWQNLSTEERQRWREEDKAVAEERAANFRKAELIKPP